MPQLPCSDLMGQHFQSGQCQSFFLLKIKKIFVRRFTAGWEVMNALKAQQILQNWTQQGESVQPQELHRAETSGNGRGESHSLNFCGTWTWFSRESFAESALLHSKALYHGMSWAWPLCDPCFAVLRSPWKWDVQSPFGNHCKINIRDKASKDDQGI